MLSQANPGATFATDIFSPFNAVDTSGLNVQGAAVHPGGVLFSTQAVDSSGNLISGPVSQTVDPLTGAIVNTPAQPQPASGFLTGLENAFGGAANFTITVLLLIGAIVILPPLLRK